MSNFRLAPSSSRHARTWPRPVELVNTFQSTIEPSLNSHAAVEVHAINADRRVVLDTKIDMFRYAKTKVSGI